MCSFRNSRTVSCCMYDLNSWMGHQDHQKGTTEEEDFWILRETDDFYDAHVTAPERADAVQNNDGTKDPPGEVFKPLREKNSKRYGTYKHVPHKDKPPQVVAKRNARERRRVQAVNSAFVRLRKVVPIENARGKRVSKVKTLQNAIQYIQRLQMLLQQDKGGYCSIDGKGNLNDMPINRDILFDEMDLQDDL